MGGCCGWVSVVGGWLLWVWVAVVGVGGWVFCVHGI